MYVKLGPKDINLREIQGNFFETKREGMLGFVLI
jgi:hypothetical protein